MTYDIKNSISWHPYFRSKTDIAFHRDDGLWNSNVEMCYLRDISILLAPDQVLSEIEVDAISDVELNGSSGIDCDRYTHVDISLM